MKFRIVLLLVIGSLQMAFAQQNVIAPVYQSHSFDGKDLKINTNQGQVLISAYDAQTIRVTYLAAQQLVADSSYVLVANPLKTKTSITVNANAVLLNTDAMQVSIAKKTMQISFSAKGKALSTNSSHSSGAAQKGLNFSLDQSEALYGTGSRAIPLNRRGYLLENYHQPHYGYSYGEQNLNVSVPLIVSSKGYALYFDNAGSGIFDLGKTRADQLAYTTQSGTLSYFVIAGSNDEILASYTRLTGKQPLPPRWALGFIQSRFGYQSATETVETVKKTIKAGYPIDATVLDLYWYGDVKTMGNHNWRRDSFPEPEKMLKELKALGVKTIPITQTFITKLSDNFELATKANLFTKTPSGKDFIIEDFWAGPSGLLDIFKPQTQQYLWNFYRQRINEGVAGWWCDLGEPEKHPDSVRHVNGAARDVHSVYPLTWSKTIFEGYRKDFPEQRVFNLARSGGAGMQRYATFPWSGDVFRSWSGFKAQIPIMLGMSMSGIGYMHSDAGGFAQGEKDAELYIRWMQFAAFTPIYRAHADPKVASPEPVFWDEATQKIVKEYIKMRYRFLPYTYSLAYLNTTTGRPLALPINYFEPANAKLASVNDEYLWGKDLLVAPIIEKGKTSRKVILPQGRWVNWLDHKTYTDSAEVKAELGQLPIFARSGSFVTLTTDLANTEKYTGDTLVVRYFPDVKASAQFTLYEDDGKNPNALSSKKYELLSFSGTPGPGTEQTLAIGASSKQKQREIYFEVVNAKAGTKPSEAGKLWIKVNDWNALKSRPGSYWFDTDKQVLHLHYHYTGAKTTVRLK